MDQLHVSITLDRCSTSRETRREYVTWKRNMKSGLAIKFPTPMSGDQMPRPREDYDDQIPSPRAGKGVKYPLFPGGGDVEASI